MTIIDINKGMFYAFLASIISGVAIFYAKISLLKIDPLVLTASRNAIAGMFFLLFFIFSGRFPDLKTVFSGSPSNRRNLTLFLLIAIIGGSLPFYLFFTGLSLTSSLAGNLIHKTLFVWVSLLSFIFLKEKPRPLFALSFVLIFLGTFFISPMKISFNFGELLIFTATLLWSLEYIMAKKILKNVSSETLGLFRMALGSVLLLSTVFLTGKGAVLLRLNSQQLAIILIGGSILFSYVFCWYKALKYAPASLVSLILTFSIVVGALLNANFAGVKITSADTGLIILTLLALALLFPRPRPRGNGSSVHYDDIYHHSADAEKQN